MQVKDREKSEIEHGRKIAHSAESIWNWTTHAGNMRAVRRAKLIIANGSIKPDQNILEVGCGTGLFTRLIYESAKPKITAIDISPDLIGLAKIKNPELNFCIQSAHNMTFNDDTFDVIYGSSVLHHLEIEIAMKEIYRVLKKNGTICFAEPNIFNPQIFFQKHFLLLKTFMNDTKHETAINRWTFKKKLEAIGFNKCVISPFDFLHPYTPPIFSKHIESLGKALEKINFVREFAGSVLIAATK